MDNNPSLKLDPRFTHLVTCGERIVLVGEDDFALFEERLVGDVVRLVDGNRSAVEIARATDGSHAPAEVHYVLMLLEDGGVLRPVGGATSPGGLAESDETTGLGAQFRGAWASRAEGSESVAVALGPEFQGVQLILSGDYLSPDLVDLVPRLLTSDSRPVLLSRLGTKAVWIGPLLRAGKSPCISCLQDRLRLNLVARTLLYSDGSAAPQDCRVERLPNGIPERAFRVLADRLHGSTGRDLEAVLRAVHVDGSPDIDHAVARVPQCASCGDPRLVVPGADVRLRAREKMPGSGGGFRTVDPSATLRRVAPTVDPLTGVVRGVRKIPVDGCDFIHVYSANHAHHYGRATVTELKEELRDHSGGKGWTDLDARVSAICESLERASSVHRGTEPSRVARRSELGSGALAPNDLMAFSKDQFRTRVEWNDRHGGGFQWIPQPYGDEAIEWSQVTSLASGEIRWIPTAFIYYGFRGAGGAFCDGDSNGLASGNCLEEAVLQGLLELVERDAVAVWWYNRLHRPGVNLRTLDDEWSMGIAAHYRALGRDLWALDLTTDLGIPVIAALSALDGREVIFGFGAHLDAGVALRRALTEVNQMLTSVILDPEERKAHLGGVFPDALRWWDSHTVETDPYLCAADGGPARLPDDVSSPPSDDLMDDIAECVRRASSVGCDVLAHDLTRPDISFPVVKVVMPGLRHFWRRLGPGRLYDLPVALGWRTQPVREDGMNPVSLFV